MTSETLTFDRTINAPASQVYRAFTRANALREWFSTAALADPRPGGRLYFWWNTGYYASGEFTAVQENQELAFTWHGRNEPAITQVQVSLQPEGEGTRVTLTHSGIGSGKGWAETVKQFQRGWQVGLENLQSILETGQDLRYVRRPMLGVMTGEFNQEIAADLGVPVTEGVRLDGVVEGMGSAAAGLQQDDVVIRIAGAEVTDWSSLTTALEAHHAGDQVEVVYYRGAEKKSATLELSGRPLPEVPATAEALAEAVRQTYEELDAELTAFLGDVSDEEAAHHPAPDEWSVNETLAHLIAGERWFHNLISDMIGDSEPWYDRWGGNVPARHEALLSVYPTLPVLLEELKRGEAETVALLAALPPEFVARKGSFTRLSYNLLEMPGYHTRTHLDQMRQAVEAARAK
jgi:uncharacterized protein YndB with AHSA1/START domain